MDRQQLNQKYSDLEAELFLEAARGNILTYEEFIERYNRLNNDYLREGEEIGDCDSSIDAGFVENALNAKKRGESLKDYAYLWSNLFNHLTVDVDVKFKDVDSEEE